MGGSTAPAVKKNQRVGRLTNHRNTRRSGDPKVHEPLIRRTGQRAAACRMSQLEGRRCFPICATKRRFHSSDLMPGCGRRRMHFWVHVGGPSQRFGGARRLPGPAKGSNRPESPGQRCHGRRVCDCHRFPRRTPAAWSSHSLVPIHVRYRRLFLSWLVWSFFLFGCGSGARAGSRSSAPPRGLGAVNSVVGINPIRIVNPRRHPPHGRYSCLRPSDRCAGIIEIGSRTR